MGLKSNIYQALIENIQPDEPGENFNFSDKAVEKIDKLAQSLEDAIVEFITSQTFRITKMQASQMNISGITAAGVTVGPPSPHTVPPISVTVPSVTVKIDEDGSATDNLKAGGNVESLSSKVILPINEVSNLG
jgi:hypothetical protein